MSRRGSTKCSTTPARRSTSSELAEKHDLPGALAQLLLQLQAGHLDGDSKALMMDAREKMLAVHSAATYTRIDRDVAPSEEVTRRPSFAKACSSWRRCELRRDEDDAAGSVFPEDSHPTHAGLS